MTTWNYRILKKQSSLGGEPNYQIHEVYYRGDGSIDCWTQEPVEPLGVSEAQLRNDIQSFLAAFRRPVLEERHINGRNVLVEERRGTADADLVADYRERSARASHYLYQMLGHDLLLRQDPSLRAAYERVETALADLHEHVAGGGPPARPAAVVAAR